MVSASLGLVCRSATGGGGEGADEAVKLGEEREVEDNGESLQQPPSDISDLPFSMPKLARRLGQAPSSPPLKLLRQPAAATQSLSLNAKPPPDSGVCSSQPCSPTFPDKPLRSRPMSLVQPGSQAGPQLNPPLHSRPGLLPLAGSSTGPFGRPTSSLEPSTADPLQCGGSAPASAVPTRKKPLLFLAPSSLSLAACKEVDTTLPLES